MAEVADIDLEIPTEGQPQQANKGKASSKKSKKKGNNKGGDAAGVLRIPNMTAPQRGRESIKAIHGANSAPDLAEGSDTPGGSSVAADTPISPQDPSPMAAASPTSPTYLTPTPAPANAAAPATVPAPTPMAEVARKPIQITATSTVAALSMPVEKFTNVVDTREAAGAASGSGLAGHAAAAKAAPEHSEVVLAVKTAPDAAAGHIVLADAAPTAVMSTDPRDSSLTSAESPRKKTPSSPIAKIASKFSFKGKGAAASASKRAGEIEPATPLSAPVREKGPYVESDRATSLIIPPKPLKLMVLKKTSKKAMAAIEESIYENAPFSGRYYWTKDASARLVSKSGNATVCRCFLRSRSATDAPRVVKIITGPNAVKCTKNEQKVLQKLCDKARRAPRLHEAFIHKGCGYLVFEPPVGTPLAQLLQPATALKAPKMDDAFVANLGVQLCKEFEAIHSAGVAHLDVNPDNLLILLGEDPHDCLRLGGFSEAQLLQPGETTEEVVGALPFTPPEAAANALAKLEGKSAPYQGQAADMWCIGVTLYQCLNRGKLPFLVQPDASGKIPEAQGAVPEGLAQEDRFRYNYLRRLNELYAEWDGCMERGEAHEALTHLLAISTKPGEAASFFRAILAVDPAKRMTPTQALAHPYIRWVVEGQEAWALDEAAAATSQSKAAGSPSLFTSLADGLKKNIGGAFRWLKSLGKKSAAPNTPAAANAPVPAAESATSEAPVGVIDASVPSTAPQA